MFARQALHTPDGHCVHTKWAPHTHTKRAPHTSSIHRACTRQTSHARQTGTALALRVHQADITHALGVHQVGTMSSLSHTSSHTRHMWAMKLVQMEGEVYFGI